MVKPSKISVSEGYSPYRFRLSEREASELLKGKSVLITSSTHMKGGKLRKDQDFVDLYLHDAVVEKCSQKGGDWTVKVKFPDPDQDPTVLHYLDESKNIQGGSFFRKLFKGLRKVGKFIGKIGKKVAPALWAAAKPVLGSFAKEAIGAVPGLPTLIESGKQVVGQIPGGDRVISAVEGGVGKVLGSGMSQRAAEAKANQVLKALKPLLVQSYVSGPAQSGGRLVGV